MNFLCSSICYIDYLELNESRVSIHNVCYLHIRKKIREGSQARFVERLIGIHVHVRIKYEICCILESENNRRRFIADFWRSNILTVYTPAVRGHD